MQNYFRHARCLVAIALVGALTACASINSVDPVAAGVRLPSNVRSSLNAFLDESASAYGTVGHSVAILRRGQLVYVRHAGLADRDIGTPISARSEYPIYSISKLFLLVALFQSAEQGQIDLDMPIGAIRADLPESWRSITLRQAISHVSGLPEYLWDIRNVPPTAEAALASIRAEPLQFPVATANNYNQTNFLLAREILERTAGQPLPAVVAKQFATAGMSHSQYMTTPEWH
jgi:CubicO group peptidase (beta-lactamase class C family)